MNVRSRAGLQQVLFQQPSWVAVFQLCQKLKGLAQQVRI